MNNYGKIYKITNTVNGKIYIGQTIQTLKNRKKDHRNCGERLQHLALCRAFKKYGFENFEWTTIYYAKDKNDLDEMEKYCLDFLFCVKITSIDNTYMPKLSIGIPYEYPVFSRS